MRISEYNKRVKQAIIQSLAEKLTEDDMVELEQIHKTSDGHTAYTCSVSRVDRIKVIVTRWGDVVGGDE